MDMERLKVAALKLQFNSSQRVRVYRKLAGLIRHNVSQTEALDRLWLHASDDGRRPDDGIAIILNEWRHAQRNGQQAFAETVRKWVPPTEFSLIHTGILSGRLETALKNVILITEGTIKLSRTVRSQLGYPLALISAVLFLFWYLSSELVPIFNRPDMVRDWTGMANILLTSAVIVRDWAPLLLAVIVMVLLAIFWALPRWTGPARVRADRVFPFSLYRLFVGSGFLLSLSAMLAAGEQLHVVLQTLQRHASPWLRERLRLTLYWVNQGTPNIGDALHMTGFGFPDREMIGDLRTYASLPTFDETLNELAQDWLEDGVRKVTEQTNYVKYGAMVLVAIVMLVVYLGFYDIIGQFRQAQI